MDKRFRASSDPPLELAMELDLANWDPPLELAMELDLANWVFAVDFTPDLEAHIKSHWSLVRQGSLRFELRFKAALGDPVTVITYAEFDNVIEIDQSRTVSADYGA